MLYISDVVNASNGFYSVTDTEDGVTEIVSEESIRGYVLAGVKIAGVSSTSKLIYPVVPTNRNKQGYMYVGRRLGASDFNCVLTTNWVDLRDGSFTVRDYPISRVSRKNGTAYILFADVLEGETVVSYPASILEFLDTNWSSDVRRLRIRVYEEYGSRDLTVTAVINMGTIDVDFSILSYLDLDNLHDFAMTTNDTKLGRCVSRIERFLTNYNSIADLGNIGNITYSSWEKYPEYKGYVFLNSKHPVLADDLLKEMFALTIKTLTVTDPKTGYDKSLREPLLLQTKFLSNQLRYPIFNELSKLYFDNKDKALGLNVFSRAHCEYNSNDSVLNKWDGTISINFTNNRGGARSNIYSQVYVSNGRLYRCSGKHYNSFLTSELSSKDNGVYHSLHGMYDFRVDEYLDSMGRGLASKDDAKIVLKSRLLTGNTELSMNAKKEVFGLKALQNGVLILPEGGQYIGKNGLSMNGVTRIVIPNGYKLVKGGAVPYEENCKLRGTLTIQSEATSSDFMASLIDGIFAANYKLCEALSRIDVLFESSQAKVPTMIGMLYSNRASLPTISNSNLNLSCLYRGIVQFFLDASEAEREKALWTVWTKIFDKGAVGDTISFANSGIRTTVTEFNIYSILKLPAKVSSAMRIASRLKRASRGRLEAISPSVKGYFDSIAGLEFSLMAAAITALNNAGYVRSNGEIILNRRQGTPVDKMVFGESYSIGNDDIGW